MIGARPSRAVDVRRALLWLALALPIVLGFVVGVIVFCLAMTWQAMVFGYQKGRGTA